MRFEERVEVPTGKAAVWRFLWDVERVAQCMPGFQEVREVSPEQYEVVIEERMGPFKIRFDMEVGVLERREEELVRLQVQGERQEAGDEQSRGAGGTPGGAGLRSDGAGYSGGYPGDG